MPSQFDVDSLRQRVNQVTDRLAQIEAQLALLSEKLGLPYVQPLDAVPADVIELARSGDRIGAMRRYRELTGVSGEEARVVVGGI
jgi:hypothetical protein